MKESETLNSVNFPENAQYFGSDDQPVELHKDAHHRVVLTPTKRIAPIDSKSGIEDNGFLQLNDYISPDAVSPRCNTTGPELSLCLRMYNDEDMDYLADIYIGSPPQKVRALFDTGSANTWVLSYPIQGLAYIQKNSSTSVMTH
mmetsp:Transcript_29546/g.45016  ORF Transcript_29546/g.45016 Transcript_29546/m.45016 type:complete len:144 (+) Transcript_29546:198-629(+)